MALNKFALENRRKDLVIRHMYFNRYLWIRYATALFFFTNLYWLLYLIVSDSNKYVYIFPGCLLLLQVVTFIEQFIIYHNNDREVKWTKRYFLVQIYYNLFFVFISFTSIRALFFPNLISSNRGKILFSLFLFGGVVLACLATKYLQIISNQRDRQFFRAREYEQLINKGRG